MIDTGQENVHPQMVQPRDQDGIHHWIASLNPAADQVRLIPPLYASALETHEIKITKSCICELFTVKIVSFSWFRLFIFVELHDLSMHIIKWSLCTAKI